MDLRDPKSPIMPSDFLVLGIDLFKGVDRVAGGSTTALSPDPPPLPEGPGSSTIIMSSAPDATGSARFFDFLFFLDGESAGGAGV